MNRTRLQTLILLAGLGLSVLLLSSARADSRCASLITAHCNQCHYKTRICQVLGTKSKWGWKRTMKRMIEYGARLTREEAEYLTACLAAAPAGAAHVCKDQNERGTK
jgi:hypothetical protein